MVNSENWYFDIKIYHNLFSEYPYDILIGEPLKTEYVDGRWRFSGLLNFLCGSHWAVQIAKRNPDGAYAGPLSPESNRIPISLGCRNDENNDNQDHSTNDTGSNPDNPGGGHYR